MVAVDTGNLLLGGRAPPSQRPATRGRAGSSWERPSQARARRPCQNRAVAAELGSFLRSRRARIRPEEVGLGGGGRRRVPGLRREELATLASVSIDYVQRLEQGRIHPSPAVLDALSRALRMNPAERQHLFTLAG